MSQYSAYCSPLHLLTKFGLDLRAISPKDILLKKKELLLEIQLKANQFIEIGCTNYSKNDVIDIFDQLGDTDNFEFHLTIAKNEHLLKFLENQTLPKHSVFVDNVTFGYEDEAKFSQFKKKISPYLAFSLNRLMGKVIAKCNYWQLMLLEPYFELLQPFDLRYAFRKFILLNTDLRTTVIQLTPLDNIFNWEKYEKFDFHEFYELANIVNREIPNFSENLAISIVNLTVHHQRHPGRKNHLVKLSELAVMLDCSKEARGILLKNIRILKTSAERKEIISRTPSIIKTMTYLAGIILMIYCLSKIFSSFSTEENESQNSPSSSFNNTRSQGVIRNPYNFNLEEFQKLHNKISNDVTNASLVKFTGSKTPNFKSPFEKFDENMRTTLISRGNIVNETRFDLLIVYWTRNGLRSYYIPPFSRCAHAITPMDEFFIYSGYNWSDDKGIEYSHFSSSKNRTYWMAFEGHFQEFDFMNLNFLKQRFNIPLGKVDNLIVKEQNRQLITSYNGTALIGR